MAVSKQHDERSEAGIPGPRRQCAGCAIRDSADLLVRVVLGPREARLDSEPSACLAVDLADSRFGRGSHVHASTACVQRALRGGFSKVFKCKVEGSLESFSTQMTEAAERRIDGLLAGARRAKQAIAGADVVRAAYRDGSAVLLVVACDAAAASKLPEVHDAVGLGRAVVFGNKQRLGAIFGRDEVAVCAVLHEGVAKAIGSARSMALPFAGARSEAWWSSEDR